MLNFVYILFANIRTLLIFKIYLIDWDNILMQLNRTELFTLIRELMSIII